METTRNNDAENPFLEFFVESIANNLSQSFTSVSHLLGAVAQDEEFSRWSMMAEHHKDEALRRVYAVTDPLVKVALAARRSSVAGVK